MEAELTSETPFSFNETLRRYHLRITTSNPNVWRHVTTRTVRMAIHMAQVAQDHSESVTSPSPVFECDAIWMRVFATARNEGAPSGLVTSLATYTHPNLVVCVCVSVCPASSLALATAIITQAALARRSAGRSAYRGSILCACEGWAGTRQAD